MEQALIDFVVITPSYRRPDKLRRNVESLLSQTNVSWQQIIVDDGSGEISANVLAWAEQYSNIHVIRLPVNMGCNRARNAALDYIRTNSLEGYVTLADDDDFYPTDALFNIQQQIQQHSAENWFIANCHTPEGKQISRIQQYGRLSYLKDYMFGKKIRGDVAHFIRSNVISDIRFTDQVKNAEEWVFFCRLAKHHDLLAVDKDILTKEYLEGGLTDSGMNRMQRLSSYCLKVDVLIDIVSAKDLAKQQILLCRELIYNGDNKEAL